MVEAAAENVLRTSLGEAPLVFDPLLPCLLALCFAPLSALFEVASPCFVSQGIFLSIKWNNIHIDLLYLNV